jgi:hypothetical protein
VTLAFDLAHRSTITVLAVPVAARFATPVPF